MIDRNFAGGQHPDLDAWWECWRALDYSWVGLSRKTRRSHDLGQESAQKYWRIDPRTGVERSDDQLLSIGELIQAPSGELWHLAHLPPRFANDGSKTWKADLSNPEWLRLDELIRTRIRRGAATSGSWVTEELRMKRLDRWSASNSDGRSFLDGCVLHGRVFEIAIEQISMRAENAAFLNNVRFHNQEFLDGFSMQGALFCGDLEFESCTFSGALNLRECRAAGAINLHRSVATKGVNLQLARVDGNFDATNAQFRHELDGSYGHYASDFTMKHASCKGAVTFISTSFCGLVDFSGIHFEDRLSFDDASFGRQTTFRDSVIDKVAFFRRIQLSDEQPHRWHSAYFQTTFKGTVDFSGLHLSRMAAFNGVRFSSGAEFDHLAESEEDLLFKAARNLAASAATEDARSGSDYQSAITLRLRQFEHGCRAIKQVKIAADHKLEALSFHRLELMSCLDQNDTPFLERFALGAYDVSSRHGMSIGAPLRSLLALTFLFAIIFATMPTASVRNWGDYVTCCSADRAIAAASLSLLNTFRPLSVWSPRTMPQFFETGPNLTRLIVQVISSMQSIAAAALLFVFGLALRRRFQLG